HTKIKEGYVADEFFNYFVSGHLFQGNALIVSFVRLIPQCGSLKRITFIAKDRVNCMMSPMSKLEPVSEIDPEISPGSNT
ncbi:17912_t:CDS:2, partial [Funneliformis caledonium]